MTEALFGPGNPDDYRETANLVWSRQGSKASAIQQSDGFRNALLVGSLECKSATGGARAMNQGAVWTPDLYPRAILLVILLSVVVRAGGPPNPAVGCPLQHLLRHLKIITKLSVEFGGEALSQEYPDACRIKGQYSRQRSGIPEREPRPNAMREIPSSHRPPSCRMKPTPRTVWMSLAGKSWSTFFRKRAICTSITLSSGVARDVSFHTSRASISLETIWF